MKTNFHFRSFLAIALLIPLAGCIFLSTTDGESEWRVGMRNDNALVIHRRAMKNHDGKEVSSSKDEFRLNQGLLNALLGMSRQDAPADPSSR